MPSNDDLIQLNTFPELRIHLIASSNRDFQYLKPGVGKDQFFPAPDHQTVITVYVCDRPRGSSFYQNRSADQRLARFIRHPAPN